MNFILHIMKLKEYYQSYNKNISKCLARSVYYGIKRQVEIPVAIRNEYNSKRKSNSRYKLTGSDRDVYILCTGPSIADVDPVGLNGKNTISVSHFYNHPKCGLFRPRFHMLAANHEPFGLDHYKQYIDGLSSWDWDFTCLFGNSPYRNSILKYFAQAPMPDFDFSFYETDLNHFRDPVSLTFSRAWNFSKTIAGSNTVLIQAIQFAVYIGARRVILLGCDHDYAENIGKDATPHFYQPEKGHDDSKLLSGISTEHWFEILAKRWRAYRMINNYCESRGVGVLNATEGSKLDVFPFVDLNSVV